MEGEDPMKTRKFFKVVIAALLVLCLFSACTREAVVDEDIDVSETFSRTLSTTEEASDESATNRPDSTEKTDETKSTTKKPSPKSTTKAPSNDKTQKSNTKSTTKKPSTKSTTNKPTTTTTKAETTTEHSHVWTVKEGEYHYESYYKCNKCGYECTTEREIVSHEYDCKGNYSVHKNKVYDSPNEWKCTKCGYTEYRYDEGIGFISDDDVHRSSGN